MVSERVACPVLPFESVTMTVKENEPFTLGVPPSTPAELNVMPVGTLLAPASANV